MSISRLPSLPAFQHSQSFFPGYIFQFFMSLPSSARRHEPPFLLCFLLKKTRFYFFYCMARTSSALSGKKENNNGQEKISPKTSKGETKCLKKRTEEYPIRGVRDRVFDVLGTITCTFCHHPFSALLSYASTSPHLWRLSCLGLRTTRWLYPPLLLRGPWYFT